MEHGWHGFDGFKTLLNLYFLSTFRFYACESRIFWSANLGLQLRPIKLFTSFIYNRNQTDFLSADIRQIRVLFKYSH
jgi:hypothetical protein